jgi:hypothetical protein
MFAVAESVKKGVESGGGTATIYQCVFICSIDISRHRSADTGVFDI